MIKEIKFGGYTARPSDHESPDGDLALSLNLINEDGALHPLTSPEVIKQAKSGDAQRVVFIHKTSAFTHYITKSGNTVRWIDSTEEMSDAHTIITFLASTTIYGIDAVGNTLIVLTSEGMHYALWKDEKYLNLGTHIPELPVSFGLQGEMIRSEEFQISFDNIGFFSGDILKELTDDNKKVITDQVLGKVNKFIADNSTNTGRFIYPFLVRYAYRLYDGSLTMHSAPVLMVCSSDLAPQCVVTNLHGNNTSVDINSAKLVLAAMSHQLDYAVDAVRLTTLKNWNDIVKSVDIFISKPIYTYDQNGECTRFSNTEYSDCYAVCKHINQQVSADTYLLRYQHETFSRLYAKTFDPVKLSAPTWRLMLPQRDAEAIKGDIVDNALFYLLKSINVDDLQTERTLIPVSKEYLPSLVTREVMTDDYNSHDILIPQRSFAYNSRINIVDLRLRLFSGFNARAAFPFTDGYVSCFTDGRPDALDTQLSVSVYYFIRREGHDIVVNGGAATFGYKTPFLWLFYPDVNAYKAILAVTAAVGRDYYEVNLAPHPTLNGAYYFGDWNGINSDGNPKVSSLPTLSTDEYRTIEQTNKIYTSEVNNPFYFPLTGINTVGTGKIKAVATAAKALSQGQFGQFPLYAFTDDGVWALEVSATGSYSAKQPITRDVCINADGVTQIDSAVLFPTDRGIMLISGSQTQCISDTINSEHPFDVLSLPGMAKLHAQLGHTSDTCLPTRPFSEFLAGCGMVYDYVHQRIIVFNRNYSYAYVYSMDSHTWAMMHSNITDRVNSYPEALAIDSNGNLVDFAVISEGEEATPALLTTRPLRLDLPFSHKTIDSIIQRGNFAKGNVQSVLYGSRDLINWHLVWSSKDHYLRGFRGTPYKYFRIALLCNLAPGESIYGASVQFTPRLTNQPR